jgi:hypothetical protein
MHNAQFRTFPPKAIRRQRRRRTLRVRLQYEPLDDFEIVELTVHAKAVRGSPSQ